MTNEITFSSCIFFIFAFKVQLKAANSRLSSLDASGYFSSWKDDFITKTNEMYNHLILWKSSCLLYHRWKILVSVLIYCGNTFCLLQSQTIIATSTNIFLPCGIKTNFVLFTAHNIYEYISFSKRVASLFLI